MIWTTHEMDSGKRTLEIAVHILVNTKVYYKDTGQQKRKKM